MAKGFDYAFSPHPSTSAIKSAGGSYVVRYISSFAPNDTNGKNLLAAEAKSLLAAGISIAVVVEEGSSRMLSGKSAGVADAQHADAVVKALGMTGVPIYFACDFDATEANQTPINAYLDGAASVIGLARVGLYGGYYPCVRAAAARKASYFWQTIAWSGTNTPGNRTDVGGFVRNLFQGSSVNVGGSDCDVNTSFTIDFGQFPRPKVVTSVKVPDLTGMSCGAAHNALVALGLVPTAGDGQQADDHVASTSPAAGTTVTTGNTVMIIGVEFHGEYVTGGMFDLADLAAKLSVPVNTLLRMTACHYSSFGDDLGALLAGILTGAIEWNTQCPPGVLLWCD